MWRSLWSLDAADTAKQAKRENPRRAPADALLLSASVANLIAVGLVLVRAGRLASFHASVLEVGDAGCLDGPDLLELHLRVPEVVEEASTIAEHHRDDVQLEFVQ
jgi:hypothetical protein